MTRLKKLILMATLLFTIGCTPNKDALIDSANTPTPHPFFASKEETATPEPTATETATTTASIAATPTARFATTTEVIFDETLHADWTLNNSRDLSFEVSNEMARTGSHALAVTPNSDFSELIFSVIEDTETIYERSRVLAIRFWVNPGASLIEPDDMLVTILGSNLNPFWVEGDDSVEGLLGPGEPVFSETRLYFLGFNRSIPANSWEVVEVYPDELIYDPLYNYVTGAIIRNSEEIIPTFFIDNFEIELIEEEEE